MPASHESNDGIGRFCRQYLQLERDLDYPSSTVLQEAHTQDVLYERLFADGAVAYPPPPWYRLRVLKELVKRIEASIDDWDQYGVSEDLMSSLSELLALPLPSELAAAQQKSYVTYSPSLLDQSHPSSSPHQITLLESRHLISAAGTTGLRTWEAALHLGQYLCANSALIQGKRMLELGAGTGYLSILCAKFLDATQVIASDGSDDVVANLPDNFFVNGLEGSDRISTMDLKWGHGLVGTEEAEWNGGRPVDVVLGADITYDKSIIPALAGTLDDLFCMFPEVKTLIAATERNRETFDAFLDVCQGRNFDVDEVDLQVPRKVDQRGPFYNDEVPIRICSIAKQ
ncbi:hypothetical protein DL771_007413 [Monosporascus sp. 5C6A]|nr:hypothetical protein DL771_007413 [Monosporascus sp. 5C6A]